jgi:hypothetical protein
MSVEFGLWRRHAQTIMLAVVTTALAFTGNFMWRVNSQLSEIVIENKHMAMQIAELKGQIAGMQAAYITRPEFNSYVERVRALESRK